MTYAILILADFIQNKGAERLIRYLHSAESVRGATLLSQPPDSGRLWATERFTWRFPRALVDVQALPASGVRGKHCGWIAVFHGTVFHGKILPGTKPGVVFAGTGTDGAATGRLHAAPTGRACSPNGLWR